MKLKETDKDGMLTHEGYTVRVNGQAEEMPLAGMYVSYGVRVFHNNQIIGSTTHPNMQEEIEKFIEFTIEQHKAKKAGVFEYLVEEEKTRPCPLCGNPLGENEFALCKKCAIKTGNTAKAHLDSRKNDINRERF